MLDILTRHSLAVAATVVVVVYAACVADDWFKGTGLTWTAIRGAAAVIVLTAIWST